MVSGQKRMKILNLAFSNNQLHFQILYDFPEFQVLFINNFFLFI